MVRRPWQWVTSYRQLLLHHSQPMPQSSIFLYAHGLGDKFACIAENHAVAKNVVWNPRVVERRPWQWVTSSELNYPVNSNLLQPMPQSSIFFWHAVQHEVLQSKVYCWSLR